MVMHEKRGVLDHTSAIKYHAPDVNCKRSQLLYAQCVLRFRGWGGGRMDPWIMPQGMAIPQGFPPQGPTCRRGVEPLRGLSRRDRHPGREIPVRAPCPYELMAHRVNTSSRTADPQDSFPQGGSFLRNADPAWHILTDLLTNTLWQCGGAGSYGSAKQGQSSHTGTLQMYRDTPAM